MTILQSLPNGFWTISVSDIISITLTSVLITLYWKMQKTQEIMASIQHKQTELMEKQADFTQANHQPLLRIDDIFGEDGEVTLSFHNGGNGPAHNLLLQAVLYKQEEQFDREPGEVSPGYKGEGSVIGPEWTPLVRKSMETVEETSKSEDSPVHSIEDGEKAIPFSSELTFQYISPGSGNYEVTFSEAMDRISKEWDCDYITIDFHIKFEGISGEWYDRALGACGNIPVRSDLTLNEALNDPQRGAPIGEPVMEDDVFSAIRLENIEM